MKKFLVTVAMIVMVLSMTACTTETQQESTTQPAAREINMGEVVTVGNYAFKLTGIRTEDILERAGMRIGPGADKIYVVVDYVSYNNDRKECGAKLSLTLDYDNGYERLSGFRYTGDVGYIINGGEANTVKTISPGKSHTDSLFEEMYESMYNDKACPLKLEISFNGEEFVYYINR